MCGVLIFLLGVISISRPWLGLGWGLKQYLVVPPELRTNGKKTLREWRWRPGLGLWPGRQVASVSVASPPKGSLLFSKLDDPRLPTRHHQHTHPHLPYLCTRQRGQEMENLEGAQSEDPISFWKPESVLFLLVLSS